MNRILCFFFSSLLSVSLIARVEVDKAIQLTGATDAERVITNLALPVNPTDAASKEYVDAQSGGGGGHWVGEAFGGGIVFAVYKDLNGDEHGLVLNLTDNSTSSVWSNVTNTSVSGTNSWDGDASTTAIIGQGGHSASGAKICSDYSGGGYTDWFLPALGQLNTLWSDFYVVQPALAGTGGATTMASVYYWSSTQGGTGDGIAFNYSNATIGASNKDSLYRVRCVRAF